MLFIGKLFKNTLIKCHVHYIVEEPTFMQFYSKIDQQKKREMLIILKYMYVPIIKYTVK